MKVVILAGSKGTRLSEYIKTISKLIIKVNGKPIIHRIINHYIKYSHKELVTLPFFSYIKLKELNYVIESVKKFDNKY